MRETFHVLASKYSDDERLIQKMWKEISTNYSESNRYYHTLTHLENLINELKFVQNEIIDWDTTLFSVFYHDLIYKSTSNKNEEESAKIAKQRLSAIRYPNDKTLKCFSMIISTKGHAISQDSDTNFFTDADLSILGKDWKSYLNYLNLIKKEYSIFPDLIYKAGRKKVLQNFLKMKSIYKTKVFIEKYEIRARENLLKELELLR